MSPVKSHRLPMRISEKILLARRVHNEPLAIMMFIGVGTTAPYEFRDSDGREYVCRWENKIGAHVMRVPMSLWSDGNHRMARACMEKRRSQYPMVVGIEYAVPTVDAEGSEGLVVRPSDPEPLGIGITEGTDDVDDADDAEGSDDGLGFDAPAAFTAAEIAGVPVRILLEHSVTDGPKRLKTLAAELGGGLTVTQIAAEVEHSNGSLQVKNGWVRLAE